VASSSAIVRDGRPWLGGHSRTLAQASAISGDIPIVVATVEATGEPVEETEPEAEATTPKPKKTNKAPEWKSLPDTEKAQYLLEHQTRHGNSEAPGPHRRRRFAPERS